MYTLNDLTLDINNALNYPAISFPDIKLYLDQAISELNSSLHISVRSIKDIIDENYTRTSKIENVVLFQTRPDGAELIPIFDEDPLDPEIETYYYNSTIGKFKIYKTTGWQEFEEIYGAYIEAGNADYYKATFITDTSICWLRTEFNNPLELDFEQYYPKDWITLFIIPYVCFKFSARDNDTGAIFSEEFTQGYQQLLIAYNIPDKVCLDKVAGLIPYTTDVKEHLPNLKIMCPTRAITEDMKIPKDIQATFGSMFDQGGW